MDKNKIAIIIGAGPAGLCAAYELLKRTDIKPIIIEELEQPGGISRTVNYKGNRMDIGGHRFFSKSDTVMKWWNDIMPIEEAESRNDDLDASVQQADSAADDCRVDTKVMLLRNRISRILYMRKFFDYPLSLSVKTILNLGIIKTAGIGFSYLFSQLFPIKPEDSLESFFINRFGRKLYRTFFKSYTEKVWGVPCREIDPSWGAQRIKGLSVSKVIVDAVKSALQSKQSVRQKQIETSLIKQFLYPCLGPGQLWEEVAARIIAGGGIINYNTSATTISVNDDASFTVTAEVAGNGRDESQAMTFSGKYLLSSMPVKNLVEAIRPEPDAEVKDVARGLCYRDFITIGILLEEMTLTNNTAIKTSNNIVPDNWIYIQEEDVKVGRLQVFNNWSPYLVKNSNTVWLGLEYFCNEGDELWMMSDQVLKELAVTELEKLGMIVPDKVLDSVVVRVPKAYPAYFGSYSEFRVIREYVDNIDNLFLIGRNGMHRYNNMDHSMLTAIEAVNCIKTGNTADKQKIWSINAEEDYHEEN